LSHGTMSCAAYFAARFRAYRRLGACPSIRICRVPSAAWADARRRDAGNVGVHRRGAATPQMSTRRRNPKGPGSGGPARFCVARRQRCASTSPPPRALNSRWAASRTQIPQAPCARRLLILGQAPSLKTQPHCRDNHHEF
jgi:hypothetical protein